MQDSYILYTRAQTSTYAQRLVFPPVIHYRAEAGIREVYTRVVKMKDVRSQAAATAAAFLFVFVRICVALGSEFPSFLRRAHALKRKLLKANRRRRGRLCIRPKHITFRTIYSRTYQLETRNQIENKKINAKFVAFAT